MDKVKDYIILGYSGHSLVVLESALSRDINFKYYCDHQENKRNPFGLSFLGIESQQLLKDNYWHIAIGSNRQRKRIYSKFYNVGFLINIIDKTSNISQYSKIGKGVFVSKGCYINTFVEIGNGVICNTGCIIEHESKIGDFSHIAPGAVLAGNVEVGEETFVGANVVVKEGVKIGSRVTIGAGSVIIHDVPDGVTIVGNPGRIIKN